MFAKTRFILTGWYLLIIMFISCIFSVGIYRLSTAELERGLRMQRYRIEIPGMPANGPFLYRQIDPQILGEIKERIIFRLIAVNGGIFLLSAFLGYFLAGRLLHPVEEMVDEQKRFIADASHEIRTPLTSMKTEIEVALRDKKMVLKDAKKLLESNLEEVNKLQEFSNYLLTLSRYQNTSLKLPMENVYVSEFLENAIQKLASITKKKKIIIQKDISNAEIEGNLLSLSELFSILLDNAIKYSQEGGKIILKSIVNRNHVIIQLKDKGIGIKASDIPYIFNRFYRADTSRAKTQIDGYGLGLSIAKSIVEIHNGKISVESIPNEGSTFTVILPLKQSQGITGHS